MLHVIAASSNPVKVDAVRAAFETVYGKENCHIEGVEVDSSVSQQPIGDKETRTGARQRVLAARTVRPEADFWVGIEAGIDDGMTFSWISIETPLQRGEARSASLMLPNTIVNEINEGKNLAVAMETLTGLADLGRQGGSISYFTDNLLTRGSVYYQAIILALAPLRNDIYQQK
jgi:inosine/xanthosine triphosphatase